MTDTPARMTFARCRDICAAFGINFADMRNQYRVKKCEMQAYKLVISYLRYDKGWPAQRIADYLRKERSTISHQLGSLKDS